jgi:hypothetical protein
LIAALNSGIGAIAGPRRRPEFEVASPRSYSTIDTKTALVGMGRQLDAEREALARCSISDPE